MLADLRRFAAAQALFAPGQQVVVGVSGGLDSMVLVHLLQACSLKLTLAHVNYGLRKGADADAAFVAAYAATHNLPLHVHAADWPAPPPSLQAAARDLRYRFLVEVAHTIGAGRVAVGHHADDQAETVLLNLFRGTGPTGLAGMPPSRPLAEDPPVALIRPLLFARRADLMDYAQANGLSWQEDASNTDEKYRRNALRHNVLPAIEEAFGPSAVAHVAAAAEKMQGYLQQVAPALAADFAACATPTPEGGTLDLELLRRHPPAWRDALLREALRHWLPGAPREASAVHRLADLLDVQPGRQVPLPGGTVWRGRKALVFVRTPQLPSESGSHLLTPEGSVALPQGTLMAHVKPLPAAVAHADPCLAYVDAERLEWPLLVRPWMPGDRLQPLGMANQKKVSDLLTDQKVPVQQRQQVYVVTSGEAIVWVVGHRLAHPYRVMPETRQVVALTLQHPR